MQLRTFTKKNTLVNYVFNACDLLRNILGKKKLRSLILMRLQLILDSVLEPKTKGDEPKKNLVKENLGETYPKTKKKVKEWHMRSIHLIINSQKNQNQEKNLSAQTH